jgi:hypothetical protein
MNTTLRWNQAGLAAALLLAGSLAASAQTEGYDLLQTPSGAAQVDLSSIPGFSPGSIGLEGVPICRTCIGSADTIMHRKDVRAGAINLELVALFLKNSGAVSFRGKPVDVYLTVNNSNGVIGNNVLPQPDQLPPSIGTMTVSSNTFDSHIQVVADVIVVLAGAGVTDPKKQLHHEMGPKVDLKSTGSIWSSTRPAAYPVACLFPANGFYPAGLVAETAPQGHAHPVTPAGSTTVGVVQRTTQCANAKEGSDEFELPGPKALNAVVRYRTCPVAGGTAYEYSIDLKNGSIPNNPCVATLTLDFGPVSGGGKVYVIPAPAAASTSVTAVQSGRAITLHFQPGVCVGQASPWFGLVSAKPPRPTPPTAFAAMTVGASLSVELPVPQP